MSATIIPFPANGRLPHAAEGAAESAAREPINHESRMRQEAIYRLAKQMLLERLSVQDN